MVKQFAALRHRRVVEDVIKYICRSFEAPGRQAMMSVVAHAPGMSSQFPMAITMSLLW